MIKPNFENSIVNISATLENFLGGKSKFKELKILKDELEKQYKNIVFVCLDGMGIYPLKENLDKQSLLRKNIKQVLTSVFPSTTTNATSSLGKADAPMQHGLFGWSLYLDKLKKVVNIYPATDTYTAEPLDREQIHKMFEFDYYFENVKSEYNITTVFPPYVDCKSNCQRYETTEEMFENISKICKAKGKQFVYAYCKEPDATMHNFGVSSLKTKRLFDKLNAQLENLVANNENTLFIITADHGHIDVSNEIDITKDKKLLETLELPIWLELRAMAFKIKPEKEQDFLSEMKKYKQIKLFKTKSLIKNGYFGEETNNASLLGDYIGVVNDLKSYCHFSTQTKKFKGQHGGLSKEEMQVPLIILNN